LWAGLPADENESVLTSRVWTSIKDIVSLLTYTRFPPRLPRLLRGGWANDIGGRFLETLITERNRLPTALDTALSAGSSDRQTLIRFNEDLERHAAPTRLNERFLESRVEALEGADCDPGPIHALTLARLIELTLLCAGSYADNGCPAEVGDLLFNPRLILVHIRGRERPVIKERHTPLTVQFAREADSRDDVIAWLRSNTFLETVKKPLLPHLTERFETCHAHPETYLDSVRERTTRVVEVTGWLSSAGIPHERDLHEWIARLSDSDREMLERRLCRFGRSTFDAQGREIRCRLQDPKESRPCSKGDICLA